MPFPRSGRRGRDDQRQPETVGEGRGHWLVARPSPAEAGETAIIGADEPLPGARPVDGNLRLAAPTVVPGHGNVSRSPELDPHDLSVVAADQPGRALRLENRDLSTPQSQVVPWQRHGPR